MKYTRVKPKRFGIALLLCLTATNTFSQEAIQTEPKKPASTSFGLRAEILGQVYTMAGVDYKLGRHAVFTGVMIQPFTKYLVNCVTGPYVSYQYYFREKKFRHYAMACTWLSITNHKIDYWQYHPDFTQNVMPASAVQSTYKREVWALLGYGFEAALNQHWYINTSIAYGIRNNYQVVHSELKEPAPFNVPEDRKHKGTSDDGMIKLGFGYRFK